MKKVNDKKKESIVDKIKRSTIEIKDKFKSGNKEKETSVICKITKKEALSGCMKQLNYKVKNKEGQEVDRNMNINIPAGIQDGNYITMYNMGDFNKDTKKASNLIIIIKVK